MRLKPGPLDNFYEKKVYFFVDFLPIDLSDPTTKFFKNFLCVSSLTVVEQKN